MRSIKLTVGIVAAAASLTLISVAAAAGTHGRASDRHGSRCRVALYVAPRVLAAGEAPLAFGRLYSCAKAGEEVGQTVTLYESSASSPGFAVAGTTTTETGGFYKVSPSALTTNSTFYAVAGGVQSGRRTVKVAAEVALEGPPEGVVPDVLRTGRRNEVVFKGTVSPVDRGALVVLQRQNAIRGNEWHRINPPTTVNGEGKFTIEHAFGVAGPANIRVVVRDAPRNVASPSNILSYEIVQAQNPQLEIESSANPISFGQSTTISGIAKQSATAAVPANTPLKLLARSARQVGFAPVAETKTNAEGHYTFPAQAPLVSTYYRVEGVGKSSAVLYEGVKYVLTAGASASTVQSGKSLLFSGTVTPGEAGHQIYLEQKDQSGTGYHVIQVGEVNANSTYSFEHTFYNGGPIPKTKVIRVKIPGGPLNGTTDSQTFSIEVTPGPAALLTPEAPGNSTLPPEGQV